MGRRWITRTGTVSNGLGGRSMFDVVVCSRGGDDQARTACMVAAVLTMALLLIWTMVVTCCGVDMRTEPGIVVFEGLSDGE